MVSTILIATLAAFIAGFVDAIAGGGGVFTLPALLYLNLPIVAALGTNKAVGAIGTSVAAWRYHSKKQTNPELLRISIPVCLLFSFLGAYLVTLVSSELLKPFIAIVIACIAVYFAFRPKLGLLNTYKELTPDRSKILVGSSSVISFYDGFLGPGTGSFFTLVMVRVLGLDFVRAAGNTKILNLCSNVGALIFFLPTGSFLPYLILPMALANIAGNYLGASFAISKGAGVVRWIFILMALLVIARLLS